VSANDDLLDILKDALSRLGTVAGRRMFGGVGVYFDGTFFAIINDGTIYFRTSETTRPNFEAEGSSAFTYLTKTGTVALGSYWCLPERLLDDPDELCRCAQDAIASARANGRAVTRKRGTAAKSRRSKSSGKLAKR
jgi:DNA transformation protein